MTADPLQNPRHESQRSKLTRKVTYNLAAAIISRSDFPKAEHLPSIFPMPFTNFGHQAMVDHELLQTILWSTIAKIQAVLKPWEARHRDLVTVNCVTAPLLALGSSLAAQTIWVGVFVGVVSLIVGGILITNRTKKFRDKLADAKARELESLLSDTWEPSDDTELAQTIHERTEWFGTGELNSERIPVLTIMDDDDPFPGYGRLQAQSTFVCRPKDDVEGRFSKPEELDVTAFSDVKKAVEHSAINDVTSGTIVTVHGDSISIDSKWLGTDKSPLLWVSRDELKEFLEQNDQASNRYYHAIQVVFPEYITVATFFFRTFLAGNSASCHLAVSTVGPPIFDHQGIRRALLRYKLDKDEGQFLKMDQPYQPSGTDKPNSRLTAMAVIRSITNNGVAFLHPMVDLRAILKLAVRDGELSPEEKNQFDKDFRRIVDQSTMWPGSMGIKNVNFRDANSYTFVKDFYAKPEMTACVRTMYDQICRAILDCFEDFGFDISDYRDEHGHYSINAEKIDSLIVGERIQMDKKDKQGNKGESSE